MPITSGRNSRLLRLAFLWFGLLLTLMYSLAANAQQRDRTLAEQIQGRVKVSDESALLRTQLRQTPGIVLAEGSNDQPVGFYRITKYRIDELALPAPIAAEVDGIKATIDKAWRVTIIGGPFTVGNAPAVIWIDDQPVGFGQESPDLNSIYTIIFDRSLIKRGARLALSYGLDRQGRSVLPESINISGTR